MLKKGGASNDKRGGPGVPLDISQPITSSPQEPRAQQAMASKLTDVPVHEGATHALLSAN